MENDFEPTLKTLSLKYNFHSYFPKPQNATNFSAARPVSDTQNNPSILPGEWQL